MNDKLIVVEQKEVAFYNDKLIAVRGSDGHIYVVIGSICDALGIDYASQIRCIHDNKNLAMGFQEVVNLTYPYDTQCSGVLRIDLISWWLTFDVRIKDLSKDARPRLQFFREEAEKVLGEAFFENPTETNRKNAIKAFKFLIIMMVFVTGLLMMLDLSMMKYFVMGGIAGLVLTFPTSIRLLQIWDPKTLSPKNSDTKTASLTWMSLVVFGGLIVGRLSLLLIGDRDEIVMVISGIGLVWAMSTLGFVTFQAWRYRKK